MDQLFTPQTEARVTAWLKSRLTSHRYSHSLAVLATVTELARHHGVAAAPVRLAALLHDCARELPPQQMLALALEWRLEVREVDRQSPILLHGKLAVVTAERELAIAHPQVASAILAHTAGHPDMSLADKLLFLADQIEPGRLYPGAARLRAAAFADIDEAIAVAVAINCRFLTSIGAPIDPETLKLRQRLLEQGLWQRAGLPAEPSA